MTFNFFDAIKKIETEIPQLLSLLEENILTPYAKFRLTITPTTTPAEMTTLLESLARTTLEKELDPLIGDFVFFMPSIKAQIDKMIAFVVSKGLAPTQKVGGEVDALSNAAGSFLGQQPQQ